MEFEINYKKNSRGTQTTWNNFSKPAVNIAAHFSGMAIGAKTKNPQVAQATTICFKSFSGGEVPSLTDLHSNRLRLNVF